MKKLNRKEKILIAMVDIDKYTAYKCEKHGIYQLRKDIDNGECPHCKIKNKPLENIEDLQKQYKHLILEI